MMMLKPRARVLFPVSVAVLAAGAVLFGAQAPARPAEEGADKVASTDSSEPRRCLYGGNYDTRIVDKSTVILTDRSSNSMEVKVKGCTLNDFDPMLMVFRGTTSVCDPIDLDLSTIPAPGFKSTCFVQSVRPLPKTKKG